MKKAKPAKKRTGPTPDLVKITGDWEAAVAHAMKVKRPTGGWESDKSNVVKKYPK